MQEVEILTHTAFLKRGVKVGKKSKKLAEKEAGEQAEEKKGAKKRKQRKEAEAPGEDDKAEEAVEKNVKEFWVFTYKDPWGPDRKSRQSSWYPTTEHAARAIYIWAQDTWWQRVRTNPGYGGPYSMESREDKISQAIRALRTIWVGQLEKMLTDQKLQEIAQDQTGFVLGALVDSDDLHNSLHSLAEGQSEETLSDILFACTKCERDHWLGPIMWGGPKAASMILSQKKLKVSACMVDEFLKEGPGEEVFIIFHSHNHFVPAWAPTFHGPFASRPWVPQDAFEGFQDPFQEAASKYGWHLDLTVRAAGDCLFHNLVVFQTLLAQQVVPRTRPTSFLQAQAVPSMGEVAAIQDLTTDQGGFESI